jgi:hypothetical protein
MTLQVERGLATNVTYLLELNRLQAGLPGAELLDAVDPRSQVQPRPGIPQRSV